MRHTGSARIATLKRLWQASRSLSRIRGGRTTSQRTPPGLPGAWDDIPLWGAYEFRILDTRPESEFALRHLPESCSIPLEEMNWRKPELPPRWRRLIVVDGQPERAEEATAWLTERGWTEAVALADPIDAWPGPWEMGPQRRTLWEPSPLLRRWAGYAEKGPALDLGCGSGRDAVYLASLGVDVLAIDTLPDALAMAEALARRTGVSIETQRMDLRRQVPQPQEPPALICMIRLNLPQLIEWAVEALRPRGLLLFEAFASEQAESGRRPRRPSKLIQPGGLTPLLGRLQEAGRARVLEYLDAPDRSGDFLIRAVLQKTP